MSDIQITHEIIERLVRLETKLDNYNGLREKLETTHSQCNSHEQRLKKIEDNITWLWRTFAGALIMGFIAASIMWR